MPIIERFCNHPRGEILPAEPRRVWEGSGFLHVEPNLLESSILRSIGQVSSSSALVYGICLSIE